MAIAIGDKVRIIGFCEDDLRRKIGRVVELVDERKSIGVIWATVEVDGKLERLNLRGLLELPKCIAPEGKLTVGKFAAWLLARPNQDALMLYQRFSENAFLELEDIVEINGIFLDKEATVMQVRPEWWDADAQGELPSPIDVMILPGN